MNIQSYHLKKRNVKISAILFFSLSLFFLCHVASHFSKKANLNYRTLPNGISYNQQETKDNFSRKNKTRDN